MFTRYMQVLDTDYNYVLVYTCQDGAQFVDEKTTTDIDSDVAFKAMIAQTKLKTGLYLLENFEGLKGIKTELIHKEKIQIYTRP